MNCLLVLEASQLTIPSRHPAFPAFPSLLGHLTWAVEESPSGALLIQLLYNAPSRLYSDIAW